MLCQVAVTLLEFPVLPTNVGRWFLISTRRFFKSTSLVISCWSICLSIGGFTSRAVLIMMVTGVEVRLSAFTLAVRVTGPFLSSIGISKRKTLFSPLLTVPISRDTPALLCRMMVTSEKAGAIPLIIGMGSAMVCPSEKLVMRTPSLLRSFPWSLFGLYGVFPYSCSRRVAMTSMSFKGRTVGSREPV